MANLTNALPQYGDMKRVEQIASGLKRTGGTYGPVVQRNEAGRPAGSGQIPQPPVAARKPVPQQHLDLMSSYAQAASVAQKWRALAQSTPNSPWVQFYATVANEQEAALARALKLQTPDF